jgi:tRNA threonylcarbamoyladenosine biosynthesis protein TsaE
MSAILVIQTKSPAATEQAGFDLAGKLHPHNLVALYGELGSGKTCFVRGLARGLKVIQTVKSPSFGIINEYNGEIPVFHMDFYRLKSLAEIEDTGWTEYLAGNGIIIIEWADQVRNMLPGNRIDVYFQILDKNTRRLEIVTGDNSGN